MVDDSRRQVQHHADHDMVDDATDNSPADLFDLLAEIGAPVNQPDPELPMWQQFEAFHERNPLLYRAVCTVAIERVRQRGRGNVRFPSIWEFVRTEVEKRTTGDAYVMNNNWRSWYSRLLMFEEVELTGAWEIRRAPEADAWIARKAAARAEQMGKAA